MQSKFKSVYLRVKAFWKALGPGLITGASNDDPSALTTFSQAGTRFGLSTLWVALFAFPILAFIQEICARIGIVTKMNLTEVVKIYYPKWLLYVLIGLCCPAFLLNIGADICVLGDTGNLLFPIIPPLYFSIAFTLLVFSLMLVLSFNRLLRIMKFVCLILLVYAIVPFFSPLNLKEVLKKSFTPTFHFNKDYLLIIIGLTGAILSPYIFSGKPPQRWNQIKRKICYCKPRVKRSLLLQCERILCLELSLQYSSCIL